MKLYTNYEATQAVFKKVIKDSGGTSLRMDNAIAEGKEMGVITPKTPRSAFDEYRNSSEAKVPLYKVDGILDLIERVGDFSMLPMYKKSKGVFKHVALRVRKDVNITEISEFSYDQMNYLASVTPKALKRFFSDYALLVTNYKKEQEKVEKLHKLLKEVKRELYGEMEEHPELYGKILDELGC